MEIEFRIIDDEKLPPVIIKKGEKDTPKILINNSHKIWICLNRGLINGMFEVFPKKVTEILDAHLREQYQDEIMDRGEIAEE